MGGYAAVPWTVVDDRELSVSARGVFLTLARHADRWGVCFPSLTTIARESGVSLASVKRGLKVLEARGHLTRERRVIQGVQYSTRYVLRGIAPGAPSEPPGARPEPVGARQEPGEAPPEPPGGSKSTPNHHQGTSVSEAPPRTRDQHHFPGAVPSEQNPRERGDPFCDGVVALYGRILPDLSPVAALTPRRRRALERLRRQDPRRGDLAWWEEYFRTVAGSPFLVTPNARGWRADFDWLLDEEHLTRVLEGRYRPRGRDAPGGEDLTAWVDRVVESVRGPGVPRLKGGVSP